VSYDATNKSQQAMQSLHRDRESKQRKRMASDWKSTQEMNKNIID
jgi:hypothetical protein